MKRLSIGAVLGGVSCLALACFGTAVQAQTAPANDAWANAVAINDPLAPTPLTPGTPYAATAANMNLATVDASDPLITCKTNQFASAAEGQMAATVWYSYTTGAAVEYVNLKATEASFTTTGFDTVLAVWTGTPASGMRLVTGGCNDEGVPNTATNSFSRIAGLRLQPNTTYSIEVAINPASVIPAAAVLRLDMAAATQLTVNTTSDPTPILLASWPVPPATTGNPCLDPAIVNGCSLRAAVETAAILGEQTPSATGANGAAVIVPAGTYVLSPWATTPNDAGTNHSQNVGGGDIDLWGSMGVYGAGMGQTLIQPAAGDRVFSTQSLLTFSAGTAPPGITANWNRLGRFTGILADMTLQGPGPAAPLPVNTLSGGLVSGGGSLNAFERVDFTGGLANGNGGAIAIAQPMQVRESRFSANTATFFAASTPGNGGAISAAVSTNTPFFVEVSDSTFSGNVSNANQPIAGGGAIATSGVLVLSNSTLSGNSTKGYGGGVLLIRPNGGEQIVEIRNSTIVDNVADSDSDNTGYGGGLYLDPATTGFPAPQPTAHTIVNSIVANNLLKTSATSAGSNCAVTPYAPGAVRVAINASYNLTNQAGADACAWSGNGNIVGPDPLLDALANNGGATPTRALQAGSAAIDGGDPAGCRTHIGKPLDTDQRGNGFPRDMGLRCDIGAFERNGLASAPGVPDLADASDSGDSATDNLTAVTKPSFAGSCSADGNNVRLSLDDGATFATGNCTGGTYSITLTAALADGAHSAKAFEIAANGPSPLSAALAFTVDTTGPVIDFVATPATWEPAQDAEFDFSIGEGRPAQCRMDAGAFEDCTAPADYFNLDLGQHTFTVRATDAAGAVSTKSYTWQIGLPAAPQPPVLAAASDSGSSSADGVTRAATLTFLDTCTNADSVKLYDGGAAAGSAATCANGVVSIDLDALAEGTHAITATATRGGNESAASTASTVVVDRTAPVLALDGTPQATMISTSATFTFHSDDAATAMQCQLDNGSSAACTSPQTYNGLALGTHHFTLTSTDLAGNVATAQQFDWTVMQPNASGAPMLTGDSDSGRSDADGITNATHTVFAGACTDGDSMQLYDGNSALGNAAACSGGVYNIAVDDLAEGLHAISITATRGGIESAKSAAASVRIDRTAPNAPAIGGHSGNATLDASVYGLAAPDALVRVREGYATVCTAIADGMANWACSGPLNGSGQRVLTATATDIAGNTSVVSPPYTLSTAGDERLFRDGFGD